MTDGRIGDSNEVASSPYAPTADITTDRSAVCRSLSSTFLLSMTVSILITITFFLIALSIWALRGFPDFYFRSSFGMLDFAIALVLCIIAGSGLGFIVWPILYVLIPKRFDRKFVAGFLLISCSGCAMLNVAKISFEFAHLRLLDSFGQVCFLALMISILIIAVILARFADGFQKLEKNSN